MGTYARIISQSLLLSTQMVWVWSAAYGWRRRAERRFTAELTQLGVPEYAVDALADAYRNMVPLSPTAYRNM